VPVAVSIAAEAETQHSILGASEQAFADLSDDD
jgi:hypothetical protein